MKNKIVSLFTVLIVALSVFAQPVLADDVITKNESTPVSATFALDDTNISKTVFDSEGNPITFTVTDITPNARALVNGEKLIQVSNFNVSMSFYVNVSNNKFTRVYGDKSSVLAGTIQNKRLVLHSPYYASYTITGNGLFGGFTHVLSARISNGTISTTFQ